MATYTTNLNLKKPATTDAADIADINGNMDAIDTFAGGILSAVYPVGSIYMSVNSTSPSTLFGGTWEQLQDRFLLAAGSDYPAGETGGEANVTLTTEEMPAHTHTLQGDHLFYISGGGSGVSASGNWGGDRTPGKNVTTSTGGGLPHNNMPPYLAVYMWKRTA